MKLRQCVLVLEQRLDHTKLNRPRLARDLSLNLLAGTLYRWFWPVTSLKIVVILRRVGQL